jgi:hypothetical protein
VPILGKGTTWQSVPWWKDAKDHQLVVLSA